MKIFLCLIASVSFFQYSTSFAQPQSIHTSWNGLKKVKTLTTIAITWINDKKDKGFVMYGTDSNDLFKKARADEKYIKELGAHVNKVTLTKLKPATYYYYKAGSAQNGWSEIFRFRTGPSPGDSSTIVVGVWGDTQDNYGNRNFEQTDTIVKQLAKFPMHFTIHTGDIVENGSVEKSWKGFFNSTQVLNANFPLMSVTGNHDVVNDTGLHTFQKPFPVYYDLFNLPNDQLNYSYVYGNTQFIAINSGYAKGAEKKDAVLFKPGSTEYRWLEQELSKAKKNKSIRWIIVYCHYPMYSFGVSLVPPWQQHLTPLLDKYDVDLCISGHRHVYERHKAIKGARIFEMTDKHLYNQPAGTIYITNGSAGGSLQGTGGSDLPTMAFTPGKKIYTYAVMHIGKDKVQFGVYDKEGERIDYFTLQK